MSKEWHRASTEVKSCLWGNGSARLGLEPEFRTVWANDICPKKSAVYDANARGSSIVIDSIANVRGADLPTAELAWASFPCKDLSLAGNLTGIDAGTRSGLFWEWIRVLDELAVEGRRPPLLTAENVVGFRSPETARTLRGPTRRCANGAIVRAR